jgi:membrane protein YdbS with pleckstrin-like domain
VGQAIVAFLIRPKPQSRYRKFWNLWHWWLGRLVLVAALGNFFFGLWLVGSSPPWYIGAAAIICAWIFIGFLKVRAGARLQRSLCAS